MTPKEQCEARKAGRNKLRAIDDEVQRRTETIMMHYPELRKVRRALRCLIARQIGKERREDGRME